MGQPPIKGLLGPALNQPRLTRDEEQDLFRRLRQGDRAAATKLVTSHLRFVLHVARRYSSQDHSLADLIQEGTVGLLEAVKRFNPDRDVQLSTYSMWWIRAAIQDYVIRSRSLVKIGTTAAQKNLFLNLRRRIGEMVEGDVLSEDFAKGLAERFNTSVAEVVNFARRIARPDASLDTSYADEDGRSALINRLQDEKPTPEDALMAENEGRLWMEWLGKALSGLPPRELFIIRRRYLTEKAPSLAALGTELGLSKERVRQLEIRALAQLNSMLQPLRDHAELGGIPTIFAQLTGASRLS